MKEYDNDNQAKIIATQLKQKYPASFGAFDINQILFIKELNTAPKTKYAETRIVTPPYTFMSDYKFIMTFYERNTIELTEAQFNMLVYHEMLHIDPTFSHIEKHDVQDFSVICDNYGSDWIQNPDLKNIL